MLPKAGELQGAEAWLRFTVATVPGCTSALPKFKYQAKIDNGKTADVDLQHLPTCLPKNPKVWPDLMAKVWCAKHKDWVEEKEEGKVVDLKKKEEEALRIQQVQQATATNTAQTEAEKALAALNTKNKVPAKDPELERTLFDCDVVLSEEALKTMAKYVSGRLGLKPPLPASVLGDMRNFGRAMDVRLFRAPHWSVWLKTSGQFPLRASAMEEGGMVEQATDTTVDPATAMLFDLGLEPVTFIGADGEEDIGFPETRIEPSEELLDLLRHINRLLDELPSL